MQNHVQQAEVFIASQMAAATRVATNPVLPQYCHWEAHFFIRCERPKRSGCRFIGSGCGWCGWLTFFLFSESTQAHDFSLRKIGPRVVLKLLSNVYCCLSFFDEKNAGVHVLSGQLVECKVRSLERSTLNIHFCNSLSTPFARLSLSHSKTGYKCMINALSLPRSHVLARGRDHFCLFCFAQLDSQSLFFCPLGGESATCVRLCIASADPHDHDD